MLELHEKQNLNYQGTIIDVETIGDYVSHVYPQYDSREFKHIKVVIFGYINKDGLNIYCAEGVSELPKLRSLIIPIINDIDQNGRPLYALNCHHEMGTIFHDLGIKLIFDKELQCRDYERKEDALVSMGINPKPFNDPFQNQRSGGLACKIAWQNRQYDQSLKHNRACLLKEQALMLKGRGTKIIPFTFNSDINTPQKPTTQTFRAWDFEQVTKLKTLWNQGQTIQNIANTMDRSNRAIWMRLQALKLLLPNIEYTDDKRNSTKDVNHA